MPEHNTITDPNIHEPKGVASANEGEIYVADVAGSGDWSLAYPQGWEYFEDTGASQSLTSGSWVDLTNDGAGGSTTSAHRLPGNSAVWDTVDDEFNWGDAGLVLGDVVDIRLDIEITAATNGDDFAVRLDLAHGTGSESTRDLGRIHVKTAGTYTYSLNTCLEMTDTVILNNPAKLAMWTDNTGNSVAVTGWFIRTTPRNSVYQG